MTKRFGRSLKESVLQQVYSKGEKSIVEIARENNICDTTIHYWLKYAKGATRPKFEPSDRYKLICEYRALNDQEKGRLLRERCLFSTDIDKWENEFMESLNNRKLTKSSEEKERKELLKEIESLKSELLKKNEALADLSAILILKKKVEALGLDWNFDEADLEQLKKKKKL